MMTVTSFAGDQCIGTGSLREIAAKAKQIQDSENGVSLLIFNDSDARQVEIDFRGSVEEMLARLPEEAREPTETDTAEAIRGRGRPKLGVVAREVTLLPRHWDWLASQPGGASIALRKLVEEARRASRAKDRKRQAQETTYRFMSVLAGDLPGFEEATRALYAGDRSRFEAQMAGWSPDVREYAGRLAADAVEGE